MAKQAVFRERNKRYYRVLHTPIWIWVFWVLPGWPLTYDRYTHGPDRRHWIWLAIIVFVVVTLVGFHWIYSRNEPKFLTPFVDKLAPFFPSAGSYATKQQQAPQP